MTMKPLMIKTLCLAAICLATPKLAQAQTFSAPYPSSGSTIIGSVGTVNPGEYGYFWSVSRGDSITESFTGTGLASVNKLDLSFPIVKNVLSSGAEVDWDVLINGTQVGTWKWTDTDPAGPFSTTYNFASIIGGGNYTIAMKVSNEVPPGFGSISVGDGRMTLTEGTATVPDGGSTMAFLGFAVCGVFGLYRKLQK